DRKDRPAAHGRRRGRGTGMSMPSSSVPRRAFAWPVIGFLVVIGLVIAASLAAYAFRGPGSGFVFFPFFGFGWVFFLLFFLFFWGMRWWGDREDRDPQEETRKESHQDGGAQLVDEDKPRRQPPEDRVGARDVHGESGHIRLRVLVWLRFKDFLRPPPGTHRAPSEVHHDAG